MKTMKKPTAFSNKVRKLLIEEIKNEIPDFDESKLKYGFVSQCGHDGYTGYVSIIYFYYLTAIEENRFNVYDIGYNFPQNELKGKLVLERGCSQATYSLEVYKEN